MKLLKPTILSISLVTTMASAAVSPALAKISQAFPNVSETVIKSILTLPALAIIPLSLLSGWLVSRMKKRQILIVGLIVYVIGGISGCFARNITELLITRGILGIGIGLIMPLSSSLIADFFKGQERTKMMGLSSSVTNLGGMFFLAVAGWLACYSWRYAFGVYALAVVSTLMVILWLPEPLVKQQQNNSYKIKVSSRVVVCAILSTLMMIAFYAVLTNLALFIEHEKQMYTSQKPLFENKAELQHCLKVGVISDVTRESFNNNGIDLSKGASIITLKPGKEWRIKDKKRAYIVKKEQGKLIILTERLGRPAYVGYALSIMTLSGVLSGLILNFLTSFLGPFCVPIAITFMGVGFGLLSQATSLFMVFLAVPFIGLSIGILIPILMLRVSRVASGPSRTLAMAIVGGAIFLGQFLSPIVLKGVAVISGEDTFRFRFGFLAVCLIISAVVAFVLAKRPVKVING